MTKRNLFLASIAFCSNVAFADDVPKCRALDIKDPKTVLAEVEEKSAVKCAGALMEALRGKLCTAENKGKKFEYTVNSDHMIGKVKVKDRNTSVTCHTVKAK